jgi:copper transport protein
MNHRIDRLVKERMITLMHRSITCRLLFIAAPLAVCLVLLFPATASAHAILLRSDPAKDAILRVAPREVRMWFSEDLNPAFSTASVVNASNAKASNINAAGQRVDNRDAHVSSSDTKEMDVTLPPNLPPAAYIVLYQTDSAQDGHILRGSFIFYVARPDGSVPTVNANALSGQQALGGNTATGQLDGPALFNLLMITLVEVGAVFWVGAQMWMILVLRPVSDNHQEERAINQRVQHRFAQRFSLPALVVLLLANVGVLVGQALNINAAAAFSPTVIASLASTGRFGTFWTMREIVIIVALVVSLYLLRAKNRPDFLNQLLPWANLALGLALFIAIAMSSHAAAVSKQVVLLAIPIDWLHLVAAALWVGGMMYLATTYLPVIRQLPIVERTRALLTTLPYYSPWAVAGVAIMAVTGPLSATFRFTSWVQLLTTAYGRTLDVKILLVGGLMVTSAIHVGLLRPRLKKEYKKYCYVSGRIPLDQETADPDRATKLLTQQVKLREGRLTRGTNRLMEILRWEPLLGVGVLLCVGLLNVFGGTLSPTAATQPTTTGPTRPFTTTVKTSDNKFSLTLNINPNRFGTNVFTVGVVDTRTGKPTTNVGVSLYTTMLDMDMGTDNVNLLPDGKGHFAASGDLSMAGNWQLRIQIRTPDNMLHEAKVQFVVPS